MPDVPKLRRKAAEFELKKQFDKALAVYVEILDSYEGSDLEVDVALFNRVGDIHLKQGSVADAVGYYEKAVDHYVETGFYNNAIALCNKILRSSPGRASIYYKLGKISAHKGFKSDAKANFLEYADRMQKSGKTTEAFRALKEFADLCPDQDDIRLMLADQLTRQNRGAEALEQLQLLHERYAHEGREAEAQATVARMQAIDPDVKPRTVSKTPSRPTGDLVFLDLNDGIAANRRSAIARRATQGLDLLATGEQEEVPKRAPIAAARPAAALPPAALPAAALPPVVAPLPPSEPELEVEPETEPEPLAFIDLGASPAEGASLPDILETSLIEPAVLDGITRASELDQIDDNQQPGLLDGLQTTGFDDESSFVNSGMILDLEPTSFEPSLRGGSIGESTDELLDFDLPQGADFSEPSSPPRSGRLSLTDIPLLDDAEPTAFASDDEAPIGGDLELIMPEDVDFSAAAHVAADAEPAIDLPLLDFDLPMPGEATAAIMGTPYAESELEMLELTDPSPDVQEEPTAVDPHAAAVTPVEDDAKSHPSTVMAAHSVELLQAMADSDPDDHSVRRRLAEAMLDAGDRDGGLRELEAAMVGSERGEDLDAAASLADEIVRLNPSSVRHHQKRVEYAFRLNERGRLLEAYLELGDALFRAGQIEKSRAIYQRVLDLAPDDARAKAALESFPATASPAPTVQPPAKGRAGTHAPAHSSAPTTRPQVSLASDDEFVNLGDWLRGDQPAKSTRMVVPEETPTGDEQADFQDMLRKFKQGIAENVEDEDHQSHYDLGVAYKEMGLLDEAIAEFQKALRAPSNRVPTYEALGQCFIEKEQYSMAATILSRALAEKGVAEDNLVGVLYLLGRCAEERRQHDVALEYYQRVFVVDIQFRDVGERMAVVEDLRS